MKSGVSRRQNTNFQLCSRYLLRFCWKVLQNMKTRNAFFANTVKRDSFVRSILRIFTMVGEKLVFCTILSSFFSDDFMRVLKSQHRVKRKFATSTGNLHVIHRSSRSSRRRPSFWAFERPEEKVRTVSSPCVRSCSLENPQSKACGKKTKCNCQRFSRQGPQRQGLALSYRDLVSGRGRAWEGTGCRNKNDPIVTLTRSSSGNLLRSILRET